MNRISFFLLKTNRKFFRKIFHSTLFAFLVFNFLSTSITIGQEISGSPFIRNFSPLDFGSRPRNWALVQDSAGIYYVGNDLNLLTFDGNHWRSIPVNYTIVRSITIDKNGKIYVGAQGDFGYLEKSKNGALYFVSMLNLIDPAERNFTDVWSLHTSEKSIYVHTAFKIFRITGNQVKSWSTTTSYHRSFLINDILYLSPFGIGLQKLIDDKLVSVPGADNYKEHQTSMMVRLKNGKILLGFQRKGIVFFDPDAKSAEKTFTRFENEAEDYLIKEGIFSATLLPDGNIAIGTLSGGIVILSPEGKLLLQADENSGLLSNMSLQVLSDRYGNLVVGNNGISIVEYNSPIRLFNKGNGLSGIILSTAWVNNTFYAGTAEGLFYFDNLERRFRKIKGVLTQCWNLHQYGRPEDQSLIVSSTFGFYEVRGTQVTQISKENFYNLTPHPENPNLIFCGQENSVTALEKINGIWKLKNIPIQGFTDFWTATFDDKLNLWLGTDIYGLIRIPMMGKGNSISQLPDQFSIDQVFRYSKNHGLPSTFRTYLFSNKNNLYAPTDGGVYVYNSTFDRFEKDTTVFKSLVGRRVFQLGFDPIGRIWFDSRQGKGYLEKQGNEWKLNEIELKRIPPSPGYTGHSSRIYCDPFGYVWYGNSEGLFQFDTKQPSGVIKSAYPKTLLREVKWNDSLVYMGHGSAQEVTINAGQNNLRFSFSSSFSSAIDNNQFSYQLVGFDDRWSNWSNKADQEFLNLPAGNYIFRVKTRNLVGLESKPAEYAFIILKPWYQEWYMYLSYVFGFGVLVFGVVRWRERSSRIETLRLEKIINQRTQELQERNDELLKSQKEILSQKEDLERQKNELTAANRKIERYNEALEAAVKERTKALLDQNQQLEQFSFVTAHNLRSPVAKVMALVNLLQNSIGEDPTKQNILQKLGQSATDLDSIIRDLGTILDLRKGPNLKMEYVNLRNMIDMIQRSFEELLSSAEIKVRPDVEVDYIITYPAYLHSILYNLLSNAIKYRSTDRISIIKIRIFKKDRSVCFEVEDNGIGFDSDKFGNKVFEPFQRLTTIKEGKGLGMFIVKSQVEALGGNINISSKPGIGTKVEFDLPSR